MLTLSVGHPEPLVGLWDSECREARAANLISAFFIPQPQGLPPLSPSKPCLLQAGSLSLWRGPPALWAIELTAMEFAGPVPIRDSQGQEVQRQEA